jgi:hypothetical protein
MQQNNLSKSTSLFTEFLPGIKCKYIFEICTPLRNTFTMKHIIRSTRETIYTVTSSSIASLTELALQHYGTRGQKNIRTKHNYEI